MIRKRKKNKNLENNENNKKIGKGSEAPRRFSEWTKSVVENLPEPKTRSIVEWRSWKFLLKWVGVPTRVSRLNNKLEFRASARDLPEKLEK